MPLVHAGHMQGIIICLICLLLSENDRVVPGRRYASAVEDTENLDGTGRLWKYISSRFSSINENNSLCI